MNACTQQIKPNLFEPSWMTYDLDKKQVDVELVSAWSANNNGFNYNGYFQGEMTLKVPSNWQVNIVFINLDGSAPHSILVTEPYTANGMPDQLSGKSAVLSRAYTDSVYANEREVMRFRAKTGDYWLYCGDKGHGINGMWLKFKADKTIKTPRVEIKDGLKEVRL